jgi:hypothetical protein
MTLGNAARAGVRLTVWCRGRANEVEPNPVERVERHGADTPPNRGPARAAVRPLTRRHRARRDAPARSTSAIRRPVRRAAPLQLDITGGGEQAGLINARGEISSIFSTPISPDKRIIGYH